MATAFDAIWNLFFKPGEAEKYNEDQERYLEETGLAECSYEDIVDAVSIAYEKGPVSQGANVGGVQNVGTGSAGSAPGATSAPPPPPPPPATMPPLEAVQHTVNYYVSNHNETYVDDRDTNVDSSVNTNVLGDHANIDIDNETNTASGDRAVAGDNNEGIATGDGAVAAGDDIEGGVNTGTNTGIITGEDSDLDNVIVGDGNTQVNDSTNVATGSGSVYDNDVDNDIDANIHNSNLEGVNFGSGTAESNDDNSTNDSFNQTDSFNTENTDSFNTDNSTNDSFNNETTDSFNTDVDTYVVEGYYIAADAPPMDDAPDMEEMDDPEMMS